MTSSTAPTQPTRRYVEQVMGMPVSLALRGRHAADADGRAAWHDVVAHLRAADHVFSTYRRDSPVSRLGRGEIELQSCPPEVAEVLGLAETARVQSGGAFDVRSTGRDGQPVLDPSGVVKGWAVERAATALARLDETDFCLSAGGDMLCAIRRPDGSPWRIGIEDPLDPTSVLATVPMHRGAVATSGTAHRGAHIVDPRTGEPAETFASITVIAESLVWADIDATAAMVLGNDAIRWLTERERRGVVVWADGRPEVYGTPGCCAPSELSAAGVRPVTLTQ